MLKLILGTDWIKNRNCIYSQIASDVAAQKGNRIIIVPELISYDAERRLCKAAGDTSSRYAEVLSFTRLARRVADDVGHSSMPCLDEGGRVVAMASAIAQVHSKLKFFASVGTKPEFISGLVETIDECKRCGVNPSEILRASTQTTGILAQKLEELAYIFEAYDGVCAHGKKDPRDQLTWLLEELECGSYAFDHVFYFDGFADFTIQQMQILTHMITNSSSVTVALTCDAPSSGKLAFERPAQTAAELIRIAKSKGVDWEIIYNHADSSDTQVIAHSLFEGNVSDLHCDSLCLFRTESVFDECEELAQRILKLVQCGCRFRDISVVCPSMEEYSGPLQMVLGRCGIPAYVSGTENILERPVIGTLISGVDAALSGFDRKDVLAYIKTALSPLSLQDADLLENYVLLWSITGSKWTQTWTMHPKGLVSQWSDEDRKHLDQLNAMRQQVITPLEKLRSKLLESNNATQQTEGLYAFLVDIHLAERLSKLADQMERDGDLQNAQVLDQLWEILINALEQMHDVLKGNLWDTDAFSRLFRILLSRYDVGTIPAVLDSITIGPINAMRCKETKHLFVLGALEGVLPAYGSSTGVLTDQDRSALRDLGVPLNGGAIDSMQTSFAEIYGVFRGATTSVTVSCPSGQPSYIYTRLKGLARDEDIVGSAFGTVMMNEKQAASYLRRFDARTVADDLGIGKTYKAIDDKVRYIHGVVDPKHIEQLYGKVFRLSASQIDRYSNCAMSYFLTYGLKAKERKPAEVNPAEFGTFVHDVLEKTAREVMEKGGFKVVDKEETLSIASDYAKAYMQDHFRDLDSERVAYLLRRNGRELSLIVEELWNELHISAFEPKMFELSFGGDNADYPPIAIHGCDQEARLRGFVDRVDVWEDQDRTFFRVVDYKTGVKTFDYCDVVNGIGLQMLLYLFALEQADSDMLGNNPIASGVQYFPARSAVVSVESPLDHTEITKKRDTQWKRSGLLLNDEAVLQAMEPDEASGRLPYKRKKDGTLTGDLANKQQFSKLKDFIFRYLQKMVDDIASGNVTPNPYTRDARKNACCYCPYGDICHKSSVEGRRIYEAISADRFWNEIEKEVGNNG